LYPYRDSLAKLLLLVFDFSQKKSGKTMPSLSFFRSEKFAKNKGVYNRKSIAFHHSFGQLFLSFFLVASYPLNA